MKRKLDKQALEDLKKQVQPLIIQLKEEKGWTIQDIADALGVLDILDKSKDAVDKWAQGVSFPPNNEVLWVVEKLKELLKKPTTVNESGFGYGTTCVSIFFPFEQRTENYKGLRTIGTVTKVNGIDAIIGYPNDSIQFGEADGLVPMLDHGGEPSVRYESLIAIKKIDMKYCRSGNQYYFIDKANQPFLRTLYKENGRYRLVAENSTRFPDLELDEYEIAAIFQVITGTGKPKPNITIRTGPNAYEDAEQ
jgi:transcriptional regulator with XRE-family HTH domain